MNRLKATLIFFLISSLVAGCNAPSSTEFTESTATTEIDSVENGDVGESCDLTCAIETLKSHGFESHVYQWPFLLQEGDILAEGIPSDESSPESTNIVVTEAAWFFFVDGAPGTLWNHPTEFVLVLQKSGELRSYVRDSYPKLNSLSLFRSAEDREASDAQIPGIVYTQTASDLNALTFAEPTPINDQLPTPPTGSDDPRVSELPKRDGETDQEYLARFQGYFEGQQSDEKTQAELDKCPVPECEGTSAKFALVIDGGRVFGGFEDIAKHLRAQGYNTRFLSSEIGDPANPHSAMDFPTSIPNVEAAFQWLAENVSSCCDEVLILMEAHGSKTGQLEMNQEETVRDFSSADPTATKKVGRPDGGFLSSFKFRALLNKIKSCRVKVFLHSCYSGKHLELGLNQIPQDFEGCMCRTVAVSSSARQPSYSGGFGTFTDAFKASGNFNEAYQTFKKESRKIPSKPDRFLTSPLVQSTDCALCRDIDEDGILTGEELVNHFSDPEKADTDGDGLLDSDEKQYSTGPRSSDSDQDGIPDGEEVERGTDPNDTDSDDDGLSDQYEKFSESDPNNPDTDGDGLKDGDEVYRTGTLPTNPDTDRDGCSDFEEVNAGSDPNDPNSHASNE